jgi:hypothetical protein
VLREPDRRRRDEERPSRSEQRTLSKHYLSKHYLTGKAPYKFVSPFLQRRVRVSHRPGRCRSRTAGFAPRNSNFSVGPYSGTAVPPARRRQTPGSLVRLYGCCVRVDASSSPPLRRASPCRTGWLVFAAPVACLLVCLLAIVFVLWICIAHRDACTTTSPAFGARRGGDQEAVDMDTNASCAGEVERKSAGTATFRGAASFLKRAGLFSAFPALGSPFGVIDPLC